MKPIVSIRQNTKYIVFFLLPSLVVIGGIVLYPLIYSFVLSFRFLNLAELYKGTRFVGLRNYVKVLTSEYFRSSLRISLFLTAICVSSEFTIGLALALVLSREFKGRGLLRTIFIIPVILTPVVVGLLWRFLFQYDGVINYLLMKVRLSPVNWTNAANSFSTIYIATIWQNFPFSFLLLLAGIEALPREPYEAAKIDGATPSKSFFYLTLPLLEPVIMIVLIIRTIDTLRIFDLVFSLTKGGPGRSTEVVSLLIYMTSFRFFHMGEGAAGSFILFFMVLVFSIVYIKVIRWGR